MQTRSHRIPGPRPVHAGAHTRWMDPAVAAAAFELQDLAPGLASLLYVGALPDATVRAILDWSEDLASSDSGRAFALERLRKVLPALVTAYLGAHTYSRADPAKERGRCIDLHDQGCGALVGAVMARLAVIAAALHGEDGRRIAAATRAGLADNLDRIATMIVAR